MLLSRFKGGLLWPALAALGAIGLILGLMTLGDARGADHKDSPSVENDLSADQTDIYAFRSPTNQDNLVVVMPVNPLTAPGGTATLTDDVTHKIFVDNTGDLAADATATITFAGGKFTIAGLSAQPITGDVTPPNQAEPIIAESGGIKAFAGPRADPFFFDLVGFKEFVADPQPPTSGLRDMGTAADTFAGTNVSAIVIEAPITALTGAATSDTGTIRVFGATDRGGPVDRVAIPAINTALVPMAQKDAFNQAREPAQDDATFGAGIQSTIEGLRTAVDNSFGSPQDGGPLGDLTPAAVRGIAVPYVVTIDFAEPVQFPNGRTLTDDVIDTMLGVALNRGGAEGISDGVDAASKAPISTFPFVAPPFQGDVAAAAQPTSTPVSMPATGGSPMGSGSDVMPFALLALGAGLLIAAGTGLTIQGARKRAE